MTSTAKLIEAVRQTCIEAALAAYEMARVDGLCHEGAWECAVDAMRTVDLDFVVIPHGLSSYGSRTISASSR